MSIKRAIREYVQNNHVFRSKLVLLSKHANEDTHPNEYDAEVRHYVSSDCMKDIFGVDCKCSEVTKTFGMYNEDCQTCTKRCMQYAIDTTVYKKVKNK